MPRRVTVACYRQREQVKPHQLLELVVPGVEAVSAAAVVSTAGQRVDGKCHPAPGFQHVREEDAKSR